MWTEAVEECDAACDLHAHALVLRPDMVYPRLLENGFFAHSVWLDAQSPPFTL